MELSGFLSKSPALLRFHSDPALSVAMADVPSPSRLLKRSESSHNCGRHYT